MGYSIWNAPSDLDYYYSNGMIEAPCCPECDDRGCIECCGPECPDCDDRGCDECLPYQDQDCPPAMSEGNWSSLLATEPATDNPQLPVRRAA